MSGNTKSNEKGHAPNFIVWKDSRFSIGVDEIDRQHMRLIQIYNSLYDSHKNGDTFQAMREAIISIVDYARTHFQSEEQLMDEAGYPGLDDHRRLHKAFIKDISDILKRLKQGREVSIFKLLAFLREWVTTHIHEEDKKIGSFLQSRKTQKSPSI